MRLSVEKKTRTFILSLSLLVLLIVLFVIRPVVNNIKNLHQKTYDLRLFLEKKYERSAVLHNSLNSIRTIADETSNFKSNVLPKGEELRLITMLEDLAHRQKVVQQIQSSNLDTSNSDYIELTMSIKGNYTDIMNYFSALESKFPFFPIYKNIQIIPDTSRQNALIGNEIFVSTFTVLFYVD